MKNIILSLTASLILTLSFQTARAQKAQKIPAKEASLIAARLKESSRPDSLEGDVFLTVTIGKIEYLAAFDSGKIVRQRKAKHPSGGFYGSYAEIAMGFVNDNWQNSVFSENEVWKSSGGQWKKVAFKEGDYLCRDVKSIPKTVLKALKVECID